MAEHEPGLYLKWMSTELGRKSGGGGPKELLVPVDSALRDALQSGVSGAAAALASIPADRAALGVPIRIQLREKALAKSNRPASLLSAADVLPQATGALGELVARATAQNLARFSTLLESTESKYQYDLSTIESISVWNPITDGFQVEDRSGISRIVAESADSAIPIRIDFFPWFTPDVTLPSGVTIADLLRSAGLEEQIDRNSYRSGQSLYVQVAGDVDVDSLSEMYGIRRAGLAPLYGIDDPITAQSSSNTRPLDGSLAAILIDGPSGAAAVGILDSGVSPGLLDSWVLARETFDPPAYVDRWHGTFVAGLVAASSELNDNESVFPSDGASFIDAQILPDGPTDESTVMVRIEEVLQKHASSVKVWNCSFANRSQLDPLEYGALARQMDEWSQQYGVLFIQATGNYSDIPVRTWPPGGNGPLQDGIAAPAEAVRSLAAGSLSHKGGVSPFGAPSTYSRRGPSFGGQQKPDVCHWSGDLTDLTGKVDGTGIWSIDDADRRAESIGTSFATPIVSAIAANVWDELEAATALPPITPELVKGLVVHSAAVADTVAPAHQHYYGAGVPSSGIQALFDAPDTFTTVHEVELSSTWLRAPFPVPACLMVEGGTKLRAEVTMTLSYAPTIDPNYGAECVRTSVEASFGVVTAGQKGPNISGKVPVDKPDGGHTWEAQRIAEGKWSPIKTHHAKFPRGASGELWGLKLSLTEREPGTQPPLQRAYVILTFKSFDSNLPVRKDGHAAVSRLSLWSAPLSNQNQIDITV
jgi:serine protease AprX